MKPRTVMSFLILNLLASSSWSQETLSLQGFPLQSFLQQVKEQNQAVRASLQSSEGAMARANEARLLTSPLFFAGLQFASDARPSQNPSFTYDKAITNVYGVGVSQQTRFGLQAKLSYNTNYYSFTNASMGTPLGTLSFWESRPTLELTQSLWSNGFGRATRANEELVEAQALSAGYMSRFQARVALVEAEVAYWKLAIARQSVAVQTSALERAHKIHEWSLRRARLQLADRSDELQAKAAVEVRKLELQAALDEEREAARALNAARHIDSDRVTEKLIEPTPELLNAIQLSSRAPHRDDVKAAEQLERAAIAGAIAATEKDSPVLDIFGSYSLTGHQSDLGAAIGDTLPANRPTQAVGLRFSVPLDFGALSTARGGWRLERDAAERSYQRKLFEQEQSWKALTDRLAEARKRLELSRAIESAQLAKLLREKERLQHARSTTYHVVLFEQDYAQAQLARIRGQGEVLNLAAQMKLFGDEL